ESGDGVPLHSSIAFDLTVTAFFPPLMTGKKIVMVPPSVGVDSLVDVLQRHRNFSYIKLTPAHLKLLSESVKPEEAGTYFHSMIIGGEALYAEDVAFWRTHAPQTKLYNEYGPTETVVGATVYQVPAKAALLGAISIGQPMANARIYLLDDLQQPVPIGETGEIYIGGPGVARGYLNRPDLTSERFLTDLFSGITGARMYKTGDLARRELDGNLVYLGRRDDQVKIRGYRIELGEVEQSLLEHPSVREAVVVAREEVPGDLRLVGYARAHEETTVTPRELRSFLQARLPEYMVPSAFVVLDRFPLTSNGKVDRKALPAPVASRQELSSEYVAPRNDVEQMVRSLWSEILGIEEIGVADNFFELGGHSLLATQIITRLRERFEINISLVHFFEAPTVAEQATIIEKLQNGEFDKSVQTISPYPRDGHLYPSFAQERVWFVQQLNPGSMSYNVQATIRFSGPLDPVIWERSLNEVVERHEIFRSSFPTVDERPIMQVHEFEYTKYPLIDLRGYPQEEREAQAQRLLAEEVAKPFDLAQLPLIRWTLLQLADEEFLMLHVESHLLHDGWSMNVFLGELMDTYRSLTDGNASTVTALPIQFADFTRWQREWLQTEEATKQLDYWKQKLAGSPPSLDLPTDHLRPPVQSHKGAVVRIELPHELCEGLRRLTRQEGMTMFITMFSAFSSLMYRYTGQRDLLIGSGIANRKTKEAERLIGMIVNNVVLRTAIDDEMSFRELLGQVRQVALEAYANQDLPFDKVVEALHPERDLSRNPLAQVIFSFHDSPINELQLPGIDVKLTEALGNGAAKFDLNVIVIPRTEQRIGRSKKEKPKGITMVLEYSTDLFEESTILRLVERYKTMLA
ncbi:MAG: condensation domain-containing protein, partial [Tumebacillaceae bacterium]